MAGLRWVLTAAVVGMLVASCSADEGSVYRVVGTGSACDDSACPPGTVVYLLRLAPPNEPLDAAKTYELVDGSPHRDVIGAYPECVLARIDGSDIASWKPAACP